MHLTDKHYNLFYFEQSRITHVLQNLNVRQCNSLSQRRIFETLIGTMTSCGVLFPRVCVFFFNLLDQMFYTDTLPWLHILVHTQWKT